MTSHSSTSSSRLKTTTVLASTSRPSSCLAGGILGLVRKHRLRDDVRIDHRCFRRLPVGASNATTVARRRSNLTGMSIPSSSSNGVSPGGQGAIPREVSRCGRTLAAKASGSVILALTVALSERLGEPRRVARCRVRRCGHIHEATSASQRRSTQHACDRRGSAGRGRAGAVAVDAVVAALGAQAGGLGERAARLGVAAELLEAAAEAEEREVVRRRLLDDGRELGRGLLVALRVEQRAAERLADRGLVGREVARAASAGSPPGGGRRPRAAPSPAGRGGRRRPSIQCRRRVERRRADLRESPAAARSCATTSRIAAATSPFGARATGCSPSGVTIVTSFSVASKPMSAREMSLTTIASRRLRASFPRAYSSAPSPCSAAKPTIVWSGAPRGGEAAQHVGRRLQRDRVGRVGAVLLELAVGRRRPGGSRRRPPPSAARRSAGTPRAHASASCAAVSTAHDASRRRGGGSDDVRGDRRVTVRARAAPPARRARSPSGRRSGCRRSGRCRSARACRPR